MRLWTSFTLLLATASPALAEGDFPFDIDAGTHRNLVAHPRAGQGVRVFFPSVEIERPSETRAVLYPGGDGRVVVQVAAGDGYATGAVLDFAEAPLVMERDGDRLSVEAALDAVALPLRDGSLAIIAFEGMRVALSVPVRPSPDVRTAGIDLRAASVTVDRALLAAPVPLETGPIDLRGRVGILMETMPADFDALRRAMRHIVVERARADLLGGTVAAQGRAEIAQGEKPTLADLRGTLVLGEFAAILQTLLSSKVLPPERIMPFALLAATLGKPSADGRDLSVVVETGADGHIVLNGKRSALRLRR